MPSQRAFALLPVRTRQGNQFAALPC